MSSDEKERTKEEAQEAKKLDDVNNVLDKTK